MRNNDWTTPPGGSRSPRRVAKTLIGSFLVGLLSIGVAWAGAGLVPVNDVTRSASGNNDAGWLQEEGTEGDNAGATNAAGLEALQADQVYAGARSVNIAPRPEDYNGVWETNQAHCETMVDKNPQETEPEHVLDSRVRWNENT
ncbi:MAG: hypothetical protein ACRDKT_04960, partial [Actinomycetota bacterium]